MWRGQRAAKMRGACGAPLGRRTRIGIPRGAINANDNQPSAGRRPVAERPRSLERRDLLTSRRPGRRLRELQRAARPYGKRRKRWRIQSARLGRRECGVERRRKRGVQRRHKRSVAWRRKLAVRRWFKCNVEWRSNLAARQHGRFELDARHGWLCGRCRGRRRRIERWFIEKQQRRSSWWQGRQRQWQWRCRRIRRWLIERRQWGSWWQGRQCQWRRRYQWQWRRRCHWRNDQCRARHPSCSRYRIEGPHLEPPHRIHCGG